MPKRSDNDPTCSKAKARKKQTREDNYVKPLDNEAASPLGCLGKHHPTSPMASCSDNSHAISDFVKNIKWTHELEIGTTPEGCLSDRACGKNPGHPQFIPIKSLSKDQLPDWWLHKDLVFEYIKAISSTTVRIRSQIVSPHRPDKILLPGMRPGATTVSYGTGYVWNVSEAVESSLPGGEEKKMEKYRFHIRTAAHVVSDDLDADNAEVELYFVDDDDKSSVETLRGWKIGGKDIDHDWCCFYCATDNKMLFDRIGRDLLKVWDLENEIEALYLDVIDSPMFTVSHPHGYAQHVSFGDIIEKIPVDIDETFEYYYYRYNIPTCPGSSGAEIISKHPEFTSYPISSFHPHHGVDTDKRFNRTATCPIQLRKANKNPY